MVSATCRHKDDLAKLLSFALFLFTHFLTAGLRLVNGMVEHYSTALVTQHSYVYIYMCIVELV